MKKAI
jgi:chromosome segregation ATPase